MSTSEKQQLDLLLTQRTGLKLPNIYVSIFCILGVDEVNNKTMPLKEALKDDTRISYYRAHLHAMLSAIREGANVKGYFAWSLLDNFEWANGYTVRFGIYFVDYNDGFKRYPEKSAYSFMKFLKK